MLATFFHAEPLVARRAAVLGEAEARHAKVRRLVCGERVRLVDGAGAVATGVLIRLARTEATVEVEEVQRVARPADVHLIAPVADRDRMLLLAEKAAELATSSWRPVLWRRSRGVTPRGEGKTFNGRVRSRMISALVQSGGAWLPMMHPEAQPAAAVAAAPAGVRWLLDSDGEPATLTECEPPVTIAVGPEGGVEPEERRLLLDGGFLPVRVAPLTLRFETAAIAGLALAHAALARASSALTQPA